MTDLCFHTNHSHPLSMAKQMECSNTRPALLDWVGRRFTVTHRQPHVPIVLVSGSRRGRTDLVISRDYIMAVACARAPRTRPSL